MGKLVKDLLLGSITIYLNFLLTIYLVEEGTFKDIGVLDHSHPELAFHPELCENTGIIHRTFIIGEKGKVEDVLHPVLDCSKVYGFK